MPFTEKMDAAENNRGVGETVFVHYMCKLNMSDCMYSLSASV